MQEDQRLDLLERKMIQQFKPKYNRGFPLETSRQKYRRVSAVNRKILFIFMREKGGVFK